MPNKTIGVFELVQAVLRRRFSEPYREDIINQVGDEIYKDRDWRRQYEQLVDELGLDQVKQAIGRHVKAITGYKTVRRTKNEPGHILHNYSILRPR